MEEGRWPPVWRSAQTLECDLVVPSAVDGALVKEFEYPHCWHCVLEKGRFNDDQIDPSRWRLDIGHGWCHGANR
jgi:hypothetical protein